MGLEMIDYLTSFMTSRGRDGRLEAESVEATDSVPIVKVSQIVNNYNKVSFLKLDV